MTDDTEAALATTPTTPNTPNTPNTPTGPSAVPRRARLVATVKRLVSLAMLVAIGVVIARTEGLGAVFTRAAELDPTFVLVAAALQFASVLLGVARWRRLLALQGLFQPYRTLLRIFLVGRFVGAFTPGTTGLDVVRAVEVGKLTGQQVRSATAIGVEKLFGLFGLALAAALVLPLGAARFFGEGATGMAALALLGVGAAFPVLMRPRMFTALVDRLPGPLARRGHAVVTRLAETAPSGRDVLVLATLSLLSHAATAACYSATAMALDVPASAPELLVVGFAIVAAMLVPISAGGAGVREGTAILLLRQIGVPASEALVVSVLGYLATQPPALLGGLLQLRGRARDQAG